MMKQKLILSIILLASYISLFAQVSEGGGVYIQNNGKLINSIVRNNYASIGFGVAGTSGEVLNSNIIDNIYISKAIMIPGDIYLNDGLVYSPEYNSNGELLPIPDSIKAKVMGVCFWSNANNDFVNAQFWIVSVDEPASMPWGPGGDISTLFDYQNPALVITDLDGKTNSSEIITGYGTSATVSNCAAKFCSQYGTPGTIGQWFLPSGGQMRELLRAMSVINDVLNNLGKTPLKTSTEYWVSNEYGAWNGWSFSTIDGMTVTGSNTSKSSNCKVRPMIIVQRNN